MPETYTNLDTNPRWIPRYLIMVAPGGTFTVPDDDLDTLANQPWFQETSGAPLVTLNGDGTFTVTADSDDLTVTGGTFTLTHPYVTVPGDGTYRI